jgi:hypothetical protein
VAFGAGIVGFLDRAFSGLPLSDDLRSEGQMTATEIVIVIAGTVVGWSLLNFGVMALMIWASNPDPHLGEAADAASREAEKLPIEIEEQPNPKVVWLPRATDRAGVRLLG